jgi:Na+-driven multidrug efflux pump
MYVSVFSTVGVRIVLSYLFAIVLDLGVMGIAWAMCCDWVFRGTVFWIRMKKGAWKKFQVI